LILDPFIGSGTSRVSAKHLNRNFIGIDKSRSWQELAISTWKK
jgi:DNA modification methylase